MVPDGTTHTLSGRTQHGNVMSHLSVWKRGGAHNMCTLRRSSLASLLACFGRGNSHSLTQTNNTTATRNAKKPQTCASKYKLERDLAKLRSVSILVTTPTARHHQPKVQPLLLLLWLLLLLFADATHPALIFSVASPLLARPQLGAAAAPVPRPQR
jgi:hypothetical protein